MSARPGPSLGYGTGSSRRPESFRPCREDGRERSGGGLTKGKEVVRSKRLLENSTGDSTRGVRGSRSNDADRGDPRRDGLRDPCLGPGIERGSTLGRTASSLGLSIGDRGGDGGKSWSRASGEAGLEEGLDAVPLWVLPYNVSQVLRLKGKGRLHGRSPVSIADD